MKNTDYIKCPYCEVLIEERDCPDLWACENKIEYRKQETILRNMQKCGFNVVTCGNCGGIILIENKKTILKEVKNLIAKSLNPDETPEMSDSLDCLYEAMKIIGDN